MKLVLELFHLQMDTVCWNSNFPAGFEKIQFLGSDSVRFVSETSQVFKFCE